MENGSHLQINKKIANFRSSSLMLLCFNLCTLRRCIENLSVRDTCQSWRTPISPRSNIAWRVLGTPKAGTTFITHTGSLTRLAAKPPYPEFMSMIFRNSGDPSFKWRVCKNYRWTEKHIPNHRVKVNIREVPMIHLCLQMVRKAL